MLLGLVAYLEVCDRRSLLQLRGLGATLSVCMRHALVTSRSCRRCSTTGPEIDECKRGLVRMDDQMVGPFTDCDMDGGLLTLASP